MWKKDGAGLNPEPFVHYGQPDHPDYRPPPNEGEKLVAEAAREIAKQNRQRKLQEAAEAARQQRESEVSGETSEFTAKQDRLFSQMLMETDRDPSRLRNRILAIEDPVDQEAAKNYFAAYLKTHQRGRSR